MTFALAALTGSPNELLAQSWYSNNPKGRKQSNDPAARVTNKYVIKGRKVCRSAFAAILQMSPDTIARHANTVAHSHKPIIYSMKWNEFKKGQKGVQRIVAIAFLKSLHLSFRLCALAGEGMETNALFAFSRARLQKRKFSEPIRENRIIFLMVFLMWDMISHGPKGLCFTVLSFAIQKKAAFVTHIPHWKTIFRIYKIPIHL